MRVIWTDYPAFMAAFTPAVAWIVCIFLTVPRDATTHRRFTTLISVPPFSLKANLGRRDRDATVRER